MPKGNAPSNHSLEGTGDAAAKSRKRGNQGASFCRITLFDWFPSGVLDFFLAVVYGIILGTIRRLSKGMLAPMVAHVAADITIFSILVIILFQYANIAIA